MFKFLLWNFGIMMKLMYLFASVLDSSFRKRLNQRNISIVIKTKNNRKVRQYLLKEGNIYHEGKDHPDPDLSIVWSSASAAYLTFLKPTPKMMIKSFTNAILNNRLRIEFKVEPFVWFLMTFRQMMNVYLNIFDRTKKE